MSVMSTTVYNDLVAQGVDKARARAFAEQLDAEAAKILERARQHAEKTVANSEEKSDAKYVGKDEYHTRDRTLATRDEMISGFAEIRKDFRFWMGVLIAFLTPVFIAAVKTIFFV